LNLAQRIVLVVASGIVIRLIALWIILNPSEGGWFGYAPDTAVLRAPIGRRFSPGLTTATLVLAVLLWALLALWLLATSKNDS
jgi:membrane associated rhomboid family serine protease